MLIPSLPITPTDTELRREVHFRPAYDKRHADPTKNYGIHGVDMHLALVGPRGAIDCCIYTSWHLSHIVEERGDAPWRNWQPTGAGVFYHSFTKNREGQEPQDTCPLLGGKPCYSDGSYILADEFFATLVRDGEDAFWAKMKELYDEWLPPVSS